MPDQVDRLPVIERWKQAMCPEHGAKLTMSNQGGWMCSSPRTHIVREPVWIEVVPADDLQGAVEAERARIITKIRHVAAGHLSPDDPWGAALRQIADILETERGQSETRGAADEEDRTDA